MENPYYDKASGVVIAKVAGFLNFDQLKKVANDANDLRVANNTSKLLNNIEDMKVLTTETVAWIKETWTPKAVQTGLKYFAFVVPKSAIGKMSMRNANDEVERTAPIEMEYFSSVQEALAWLKSK